MTEIDPPSATITRRRDLSTPVVGVIRRGDRLVVATESRGVLVGTLRSAPVERAAPDAAESPDAGESAPALIDAYQQFLDGLAAAATCEDEPDLAAATSMPDGRFAAYLDGVDVDARTLTFDPIQWLSGERARAAHEQAHPDQPGGSPNDYVILDEESAQVLLEVAEDVAVRLVRLREDGNAEDGPGDWAELPAYLAGYDPGDRRLSYNPFWITVARAAAPHGGRPGHCPV